MDFNYYQRSALFRFMRWFGGAGVFAFDLAGKNYETGAFMSPRRSGAIDLTPDVVLNHYLGWLRAQNAAGFNIFIRPARSLCHPILFLDDVPVETARSSIARYWSIAVQTSAGNTQLWIVADRAMDERDRGQAQRELRRVFRVGDYASTGGEHFGRAPGFRNRKPAHNDWTTVLCASERGGQFVVPSLSAASRVPPPCVPGEVHGVRTSGTHPRQGELGRRRSESEREFGLSVGRFRQGWTIKEVEAFVLDLAMQRGKHGGRAAALRDYAHRTALAAYAASQKPRP